MEQNEENKTEIAVDSSLISPSSLNSQQPVVGSGISMRAEGFYGLAGDLVRAIEPQTEADPVAILAQFLSGLGNLLGNKLHYLVGCTKHALKVNVVLVGETSRARKGLSLGIVLDILSRVDTDWTKNHVMSGLASGEGLIAIVADNPPLNIKPLTDKRLLITEEEFAAALKVMARDGSILSPIIRKAWDSAELCNLTKNNPLIASNTHISIIGHITQEELVKQLTETEMANGFGNRFLWFLVRRSKLMPNGGNINGIGLEDIIERVKQAVNFGKTKDIIIMSKKAGELWDEIYKKLDEPKPGMVGAMTARGEAYIIRIACIYAILDLSAEIRPEHLEAALAAWEYSEQCVASIFGNTLGDSTADTILVALRNNSNGLDRTNISRLFMRHKHASEINRALGILSKFGLAKYSKVTQTGGRPEEIWVAIAK